jgi:hypothetical protein
LLHDSNASSFGLEEVKRLFANWRKERKSRRQPIPDFLWKAAGQLFPRYPLGVIAREQSRVGSNRSRAAFGERSRLKNKLGRFFYKSSTQSHDIWNGI